MKLSHIALVGLVAVATACSGPADKSQKNNKVVVTNNDNGVMGPDNNMTCGVSCDDRNACTIDSTTTAADCSTSCSYELETMCVSDDGCCPAGCTTDNDADCALPNTDPVCNTECQASADACYAVVTSRDASNCVVGCDYAPITTCVSGDGCCPSGCSNDTDSDCPVEANNVSPNNDSPNNCTPRTCGQLSATCGMLTDGCGGTLNCGSCGAGEECTPEGQCVDERDGCDASQPGSCSNTTPYCVMGTCVECIGDADCGGADICIDGFCAASPDCTVDPSICPENYECVSGACELPTGGACSPQDPTSCPQGTFCDSETLVCVAPGGDQGCGFCNPDCTCDGDLVCNGFVCEGCTMEADGSSDCPDGQTCLPFYGICFTL